jgi:hypothetical protein
MNHAVNPGISGGFLSPASLRGTARLTGRIRLTFRCRHRVSVCRQYWRETQPAYRLWCFLRTANPDTYISSDYGNVDTAAVATV